MTVRFSTGVRNALLEGHGISSLFNKGSIRIYTGAQPATADAAFTGTLLGTVTLSSATLTPETRATGAITVTGGSVSVTTVTVGTFNIIPDGAVAYNASINQTASDLCDAINRNAVFDATVSTNVVTITARPGSGTAYNGLTLTSTGSVTASYGAGTVSGGLASANALTFAPPSAGVLGKPTTATWSFVGVAAGTAGWFRFVGSIADAGSAIIGAPHYARIDGSIATSGGDMGLSNIAVTVGAPNTVDRFNITQPAA